MSQPTYVFTPLGSDAFQRPNENPLNTANWRVQWGPHGLQLVNHQAVTSLAGNFGLEAWIGTAIPALNQYAKATIGSWGGVNAEIDLYLQASDATLATAPSALLFNNGTNYVILMFDTAVQVGPTYVLPSAPKPGDTLLMGIFGTSWFVWYNGVQVISGTSSGFGPSSRTGFDVLNNSSISDTGVSAIEFGTVSLPPPVLLTGGDAVSQQFKNWIAAQSRRRQEYLISLRASLRGKKEKRIM